MKKLLLLSLMSLSLFSCQKEDVQPNQPQNTTELNKIEIHSQSGYLLLWLDGQQIYVKPFVGESSNTCGTIDTTFYVDDETYLSVLLGANSVNSNGEYIDNKFLLKIDDNTIIDTNTFQNDYSFNSYIN